ncbi:hypothetical protein BKE38_28040 [Pseudoroseomonas deserti]|uniref:YcxB-like protein domain-containing protein n=1 Tax=Teichococcus deserti TaxID=1817963 RepID=A0A1V2GU07_9PROT|nr:hypothetical protein [Pseudoroseomonas deserti]ONG44595.1 hypothetical protein BKE38_28040 [Pseudoroseomonas deserti]
MGLVAELGPIEQELLVPALDIGGYLALQRALLQPLRRPFFPRGLLRLTLWIGACMLLGLGLGWLSARQGWMGELWLARGDTGQDWRLGGAAVVFAGLGLWMLGLTMGVLLCMRQQMRLLRWLHREAGEMLGAHNLIMGEHAMLWRNASRSVLLPWARVNRLVATPGQLFIVVDQASALWLPEALLAALPDRAGFMAYLESRIPTPLKEARA